MTYALIFWGSAPECYVNRIFILQKRALRNICLLPPDTPCKQYFINHKILTLPCLYILELLIFTKKNPFRFASISSKSNINTRNKSKLRIPAHNTTKFEKSPYYMCIIAFNKLPTELINEPSFWKFKNKIKNILLPKCITVSKNF